MAKRKSSKAYRREIPFYQTWGRVERRLVSELEATTLRDLISAVTS